MNQSTRVMEGPTQMGRAPIIHHRPKVRRGKPRKMWWSECPCGHAKFYRTWRMAFIDALIHSEELK